MEQLAHRWRLLLSFRVPVLHVVTGLTPPPPAALLQSVMSQGRQAFRH